MYIVINAVLEESQAAIKIARRNNNNLRYADNTILMAESEEQTEAMAETNEPLDEGNRGE